MVHPRSVVAVARSMTILVLIAVLAVASISAFLYLSLLGPSCGNGSGNGKTRGAVVLADFLSVPSGRNHSSGDREWQFTLADLGRVGVKSVCATLTTGAGRVTQTAPGVPSDGSTSAGGAVAGDVQPGRSYPVNISVVYDNGDSQLLRSSVEAITASGSSGIGDASILNDTLYLPLANETGVLDGFWTYVVGITGTVPIGSMTATPSFAQPNELLPPFLTNLVPGDEKSSGTGLLLAAFNLRAGETYSITFSFFFPDGETKNITTSVTAEAV